MYERYFWLAIIAVMNGRELNIFIRYSSETYLTEIWHHTPMIHSELYEKLRKQDVILIMLFLKR